MLILKCILLLLFSYFPCKGICNEPGSNDEVKLRSAYDSTPWRSNLNSVFLEWPKALSRDAFSRLRKAIWGSNNRTRKRLSRSSKYENFIGSNLFDGDRKKCFSLEDTGLLTARREFERTMIPEIMPLKIYDDGNISVIMKYFSYGHLLVRRMDDSSMSRVVRKAFFDTFGGFLHHYLLPVTKMSFYVGNVQLTTVQKVLDYYQKCRFFLNTNGNGWRSPIRYSLRDLKSFGIRSLYTNGNGPYDVDGNSDHCVGLSLLANTDGDIFEENMLVPLPKIDIEDKDGYLNNIWLPYERKTVYDLKASSSAFLIVRFFKKVSQCYSQKETPRDTFDMQFKEWISDSLLGHVFDETFYPGLGGLISLYNNLRTSTEEEIENKNNSDSKILYTKNENEDVCGTKIKRKSPKYLNLETQTKTEKACDMDWYNIIHTPPLDKSKRKKSNNKYAKKKQDKTNDDELDWSDWPSSLDGFNHSAEESSWGEKVKTVIKYLICLLLILFALGFLCKMIALCMNMIFGDLPLFKGDCFYGVFFASSKKHPEHESPQSRSPDNKSVNQKKYPRSFSTENTASTNKYTSSSPEKRSFQKDTESAQLESKGESSSPKKIWKCHRVSKNESTEDENFLSVENYFVLLPSPSRDKDKNCLPIENYCELFPSTSRGRSRDKNQRASGKKDFNCFRKRSKNTESSKDSEKSKPSSSEIETPRTKENKSKSSPEGSMKIVKRRRSSRCYKPGYYKSQTPRRKENKPKSSPEESMKIAKRRRSSRCCEPSSSKIETPRAKSPEHSPRYEIIIRNVDERPRRSRRAIIMFSGAESNENSGGKIERLLGGKSERAPETSSDSPSPEEGSWKTFYDF